MVKKKIIFSHTIFEEKKNESSCSLTESYRKVEKYFWFAVRKNRHTHTHIGSEHNPINIVDDAHQPSSEWEREGRRRKVGGKKKKDRTQIEQWKCEKTNSHTHTPRNTPRTQSRWLRDDGNSSTIAHCRKAFFHIYIYIWFFPSRLHYLYHIKNRKKKKTKLLLHSIGCRFVGIEWEPNRKQQQQRIMRQTKRVPLWLFYTSNFFFLLIFLSFKCVCFFFFYLPRDCCSRRTETEIVLISGQAQHEAKQTAQPKMSRDS